MPSFHCPFRATLFVSVLLMLQAVAVCGLAEEYSPESVDDQEVVALFQSLETAFRNKRAPDIIANLYKKFSYIMTYSTDDSFNTVEQNIESYRSSVGSFFINNPEIQEFTITVDRIERSEEDIVVLARIKSVVVLNGIVNSCETSSNYSLLRHKGRLLIKDIRGNATCSNKKVEEEGL